MGRLIIGRAAFRVLEIVFGSRCAHRVCNRCEQDLTSIFKSSCRFPGGLNESSRLIMAAAVRTQGCGRLPPECKFIDIKPLYWRTLFSGVLSSNHKPSLTPRLSSPSLSPATNRKTARPKSRDIFLSELFRLMLFLTLFKQSLIKE